MKTLLATLVFAVSATAALADSPRPGGAGLTRAQVEAEALKARAERGQFVSNEYNPLADVPLKTWAQIRAEAAKASGARVGSASAS